MKAIIRTKIIGTGTSENPRRPYLASQNVPASMMELADNECLCRVAGTPTQISAIVADAEITQQTDEEALTIIKNKYPNSDTENIDIGDSEIDNIAEAQGLKPKLRADIVMPTRGKQLLQDQENYLMSHICEKMKFTKAWWDKEAKNGKWATGSDLEKDIKDGKGEAHEFTLSRIRMKHLKITCSCDKLNKVAHDITCIEVPDIPISDRKELSLEAAQAQGYAPCPVCKPFVV